MEILGWLWWLAAKLAGLVFGLTWFLLGGWVSTLAQIAVIALVIFGYKYGWRRAPQEILARGGALGRYIWGWVRARETSAGGALARVEIRDRVVERVVRRKEPGDINLSTLLNIVVLAGLGLLAAL